MDLKLVYYPDPRLRVRAVAVPKVDEALREAVPAMFKIMYRTRGIGLAGPQVGIGRRFVVANLTGDPEVKDAEQVFINPEILDCSGEMKEEEGCLSLPGIYPVIRRDARVTVRFQNLEGKTVERSVEGLEAKLFQHEIDHLDGILIVDKMSPADLKQWRTLLDELEEDFNSGGPEGLKRRGGRPRRSKSPL